MFKFNVDLIQKCYNMTNPRDKGQISDPSVFPDVTKRDATVHTNTQNK